MPRIYYEGAEVNSFTVADLATRDALQKTEGMLVYVLSNATTYRLNPDLTTWAISISSNLVESDDSNLIIAGQVFS